jgi:serine/threonine protein kinase
VSKNIDRSIAYLAVGDFDITKNIEQASKHTTIGTPGYMAPELLQGHKYGFPVDVFSFGMVLYELLTLHRPYEEEKSPFRVSQYIIEGRRPTMPGLDSSYAELLKLINKCLRSKPDRRPTIAQCKALLAKLMVGK